MIFVCSLCCCQIGQGCRCPQPTKANYAVLAVRRNCAADYKGLQLQGRHKGQGCRHPLAGSCNCAEYSYVPPLGLVESEFSAAPRSSCCPSPRQSTLTVRRTRACLRQDLSPANKGLQPHCSLLPPSHPLTLETFSLCTPRRGVLGFSIFQMFSCRHPNVHMTHIVIMST